MKYNMNGWDKSISDLHSMLKTTENNILWKASQLAMIREAGVKKLKWNNSKGKPYIGNNKGKMFS